MKRAKQTVTMINEVNRYLEVNCIKNQYNDLFGAFQDALLKANIYNGFNYYKHKEINGEKGLVLAGTSDPAKYDCLQFC